MIIYQQQIACHERKGIMGWTWNVVAKIREYKLKRKLPSSHIYLLQEIQEFNSSKSSSICAYDLKALAKELNYKSTNHLYTILKNLADKKIIIRKPTGIKGFEELGLNPEVFGPVLTPEQQEWENKRLNPSLTNHKRTPKNGAEEHPNREQATPESGAVTLQNGSSSHPNREQTSYQGPVIINEMQPSSSSSISISSRRKQTQRFGVEELSPEEHEKSLASMKKELSSLPFLRRLP